MSSQTFSIEQFLTTTPDATPHEDSVKSPDSQISSPLKPNAEEDAARAIYEARQSFLAFHYF